jgi:hypothetical protein
MTPPPAPSRSRVVRPQFFRSAATGSLAPDVRDCLVGLTTVTDDSGWLLWSPEEIATTLYPYAPPRRRLRDLERRAAVLAAAGLLVIKPCGCAEIPTLIEHFGIKGGDRTQKVWEWHSRHPSDYGLRRATDDSVSVSVSSSSSFLVDEVGASSSRAHDGPNGTTTEVVPFVAGTCEECHRPTSVHAPLCSQTSHLRAVQ